MVSCSSLAGNNCLLIPSTCPSYGCTSSVSFMFLVSPFLLRLLCLPVSHPKPLSELFIPSLVSCLVLFTDLILYPYATGSLHACLYSCSSLCPVSPAHQFHSAFACSHLHLYPSSLPESPVNKHFFIYSNSEYVSCI